MRPTGNEAPNMKDLTGPLVRYNAWLNNFGSQVTAIGASFGLTTVLGGSTVTQIGAMVTFWNSTYLAGTQRATRTSVTVANMTQLRYGPKPAEATTANPGTGLPGPVGGQVGILRSIIRSIQGISGLTSGAREALGISQLMNKRKKTFVPEAGPEISIYKQTPGVLAIRYNQVGVGQDNKSKPKGCKGVLVKWSDGGTESGEEVFTRSPCYIRIKDRARGRALTVRAWWIMGNKLYSPPSAELPAFGS